MNVREFLGLRATHNPHRWYLPVEQKISTRGGFLFGGCGLAAAVSALEATSERPLVWATAQYLDYAKPPSFLDIDVIIPVAGKRITQARALGHVGDREILTVNAALGERPLDVVAQWEARPEVPAPSECPVAPSWHDVAGTIDSRFEIRVARGRYGAERDGTPSHDGRSALWIRVPEGIDMSAGLLAIIADWHRSGSGPLGRGQQPRQHDPHSHARPDRLGALRHSHPRDQPRLRARRHPPLGGGRDAARDRQPVDDRPHPRLSSHRGRERGPPACAAPPSQGDCSQTWRPARCARVATSRDQPACVVAPPS
jgi:acyl-CoA thioesterase-2